MGCDRAGWYSWDRLDNGGRPSAERIHPEWQQISVGDRCSTSTPGGNAWFEVAPSSRSGSSRCARRSTVRGRPFDAAGPATALSPTRSGASCSMSSPGGRTRLVVSGYGRPAALAQGDREPPVLGARPLDHADPPVRRPAAPGPGDRPVSAGAAPSLDALVGALARAGAPAERRGPRDARVVGLRRRRAGAEDQAAGQVAVPRLQHPRAPAGHVPRRGAAQPAPGTAPVPAHRRDRAGPGAGSR